MTTLSVSVMMHPSREHFRGYLLERLGDVPVIVDDGAGVWATCRRAWQQRDTAADFHLVVQDDALVCQDFTARAITALEAMRTGHACSFYFGRRAAYDQLAPDALRLGAIVLPQLHWGLAVCLPRDLVEPMLAFGDAYDAAAHLDDTRIKAFLCSRGVPVWHPVPSLVDHRAELPSLVTGLVEQNRRAYYFIDGGSSS